MIIVRSVNMLIGNYVTRTAWPTLYSVSTPPQTREWCAKELRAYYLPIPAEHLIHLRIHCVCSVSYQ